jgi:hypothetical protein
MKYKFIYADMRNATDYEHLPTQRHANTVRAYPDESADILDDLLTEAGDGNVTRMGFIAFEPGDLVNRILEFIAPAYISVESLTPIGREIWWKVEVTCE